MCVDACILSNRPKRSNLDLASLADKSQRTCLFAVLTDSSHLWLVYIVIDMVKGQAARHPLPLGFQLSPEISHTGLNVYQCMYTQNGDATG